MRRTSSLSLILAGSLWLLGVAAGQTPGGGTPGQSSPATSPGQATPGQVTPGINNPMDTMSTTHQKVDDKKFVKDAALGGMTEVQLGQLAAQKASGDRVKQFAQKMVNDHSKANDQLKEVASKENIPIANTLDAKHQARIDKLSKLSGAEFDKAYVKDQLKDHQSDVKDFAAEAQNGTNSNVKAFASTTLPTLQQHLELVKNLNKSEKEAAKQAKKASG